MRKKNKGHQHRQGHQSASNNSQRDDSSEEKRKKKDKARMMTISFDDQEEGKRMREILRLRCLKSDWHFLLLL